MLTVKANNQGSSQVYIRVSDFLSYFKYEKEVSIFLYRFHEPR